MYLGQVRHWLVLDLESLALRTLTSPPTTKIYYNLTHENLSKISKHSQKQIIRTPSDTNYTYLWFVTFQNKSWISPTLLLLDRNWPGHTRWVGAYKLNAQCGSKITSHMWCFSLDSNSLGADTSLISVGSTFHNKWVRKKKLDLNAGDEALIEHFRDSLSRWLVRIEDNFCIPVSPDRWDGGLITDLRPHTVSSSSSGLRYAGSLVTDKLWTTLWNTSKSVYSNFLSKGRRSRSLSLLMYSRSL